MALVKVIRDKPEVQGGKTTAMVEEKFLDSVLGDGWKLADSKKEIVEEPKKEVFTEKPVDEIAKESVEKPVKKSKKAL